MTAKTTQTVIYIVIAIGLAWSVYNAILYKVL